MGSSSMANFTTHGIDAVCMAFEEIAQMPDHVIEDILLAEAQVVKREEKSSAESMLQGPYYEGGVAAALEIGKVKRTSDGGHLFVTFEGMQHKNRVAEIAFVNEYGKESQPPRQFIRTAIAKCEDEAVEAGADVYEKWLQSVGL